MNKLIVFLHLKEKCINSILIYALKKIKNRLISESVFVLSNKANNGRIKIN